MDETEEAFEGDFLRLEIDLDYEFDAPRCFDFSRLESPSEAREAELWFEMAGIHTPHPLVAQMNIEDDVGPEFSVLDANYKATCISKGLCLLCYFAGYLIVVCSKMLRNIIKSVMSRPFFRRLYFDQTFCRSYWPSIIDRFK